MGCVKCDNPKFFFVHIPKTGGTSVSQALHKLDIETTLMQGHRYLGWLMTKHELQNHHKFTVVRNPYDRFISLWLTRKKRHGCSLDDFIRGISLRKFGWYALRSQSRWVSDRRGKLLIDHVVKFEGLLTGIRGWGLTHGLNITKLPHMRKTQRDRDYQKYYETEEQINFVKQRYLNDLTNFNYNF